MPWIPIPGVDATIKGRWLNLSPPRRFVCDLLHFASRVPSVPSQRRMRLADVIEARGRGTQRISWCAIFIKAYAIVAASRPELRRAYMPWIWPHLYEHPFSVASFTVERTYQGEPGVFYGKIPQPERQSLRALDAVVRHHQTADVEEVPTFLQAMQLARLPRPIRRAAWWLGLYSDGVCRAHFFGTFGISVVGSLGAAGLHILSPLTTTVNYGTFEEDGSLDVRITYDHRVIDGAPAARALAELEAVLHDEIRSELIALANADAGHQQPCVVSDVA
ncbi:MAG: 2-oxo acid dehydrogenase subunit E2 [Pirellulales bacterium]